MGVTPLRRNGFPCLVRLRVHRVHYIRRKLEENIHTTYTSVGLASWAQLSNLLHAFIRSDLFMKIHISMYPRMLELRPVFAYLPICAKKRGTRLMKFVFLTQRLNQGFMNSMRVGTRPKLEKVSVICFYGIFRRRNFPAACRR